MKTMVGGFSEQFKTRLVFRTKPNQSYYDWDSTRENKKQIGQQH